MNIYKTFLKPVFFLFDPEFIHDRFVFFGTILGSFSLTRSVVSKFCSYEDTALEQNVLGIHFKNPVGLSAGFDKNAELTSIIPSVGFGHMEIGSITNNPSKGNPKPRLWRLKKSQGLLVYYGLKNDGAEIIRSRLVGKKFAIPVSTSIAMTNCKENLDTEHAIKDYVQGFKQFIDIGDFYTINISCPNAQGGQPFMDAQKLDSLLTAIDPIQTEKPVFIKFSPDMDFGTVDALLDIAKNHRVHGIVCSNLTKNRDNPKLLDKDIPDYGGVSGKPVQDISDALLAHIYKREGKRFVLVGCGGVFNAEDAYKKIRLGASLIHMITGMIFEGPQVVGGINKGLAKLLKRDGFTNIQDAVGVDNR